MKFLTNEVQSEEISRTASRRERTGISDESFRMIVTCERLKSKLRGEREQFRAVWHLSEPLCSFGPHEALFLENKQPTNGGTHN